MADVLIVGAGPVGLLLSGLLRQAGVDVEVVERRTAAGSGTRAIGIHAPVLAALEHSGLTAELLARAVRVDRGEARADGRVLGVVRFDRLSIRFPFVATLPQAATEEVLRSHAGPVSREVTVTRVTDGEDAAEVCVDGGASLRTPIVIVAGGWSGRSTVYRRVPTHVYPDRYLMADVAVGDREDDRIAVVNLDGDGVLESFPLPGGHRRMVVWDRPPAADGPAARAARLASALERRGEAGAAASVTEASSFGVRRVVSPALRRGRVVVIGDAAHEVSPIGGQGMNLGLLDAATLAPILVTWARTGVAPDAELARWERRRVRAARTAARLAAVNTALGRPLGPWAHGARSAVLRGALAPPIGRAFAHAYAMGLDPDA